MNFFETLSSWRHITNFWTLLFFGAIVFDFATENLLTNNGIILALAVIYIASLAIYGSEKEFRRWDHGHLGQHPGEIYVFLWTILLVMIFVADLGLSSLYHIPTEVPVSYVAALTILAITKESKRRFGRRERDKVASKIEEKEKIKKPSTAVRNKKIKK